ncbi:MAG: homoserine O-acetyltransferase [Sphingobacteriales bacterium]|nr:MAG: homoserine O-acetyltransferase [Sphingobacteriales bacterium]
MKASNIYRHKKPFVLESGKKIKDLEIGYETWGTLNSDKSNVIWVCHALTANANVLDWWKGLFGEHALFNPNEHFIVCANILGSCYGSHSPLHGDHVTGQPYYLSFPDITVKDMVNAHKLLVDHLNIENLKVLIGGSLGGQQVLEWAIEYPNMVENLVAIATNASHSPWGIAFNESQRLAIKTDRTFYANQPDGGIKGLKAARSIALLSYRTYSAYGATQLESVNSKTEDFRASSYQNYQGEKLCKRFNAYSYWYLTKAMDSHNVGRGRKSIQDALSKIISNTLVIGIENDVLFPWQEQEFIYQNINGAHFIKLHSEYGHDGFLIETDQLTHHIGNFLKESAQKKILKLNRTA